MDLQPASVTTLVESSDTILSSPTPDVPIVEKPVKKPTRQWAAWTRQEEENFFNALRQVGKNFEKITCRVQSKNKDQVRHYYYRLVRRMNKLLGPGFGLDAKNSKDTIAAMLRWWSLLEKYSCTASKLHLKPRRFKTFVEALAHQLLKDRNKSRKKRHPHGENFSSIPEATATILRGGHTNESHSVATLLINGQLTQKVGSTKGSSTKGIAANDVYSRGGPFTEKVAKPRRRTNLVASAAYKRWEKAAMAGVSLVADAAEQLERTNSASDTIFDQMAPNIVSHEHFSATSGDIVSFPSNAKQSTYSNFGDICSHQIGNAQPSKLKLQLFPVDEGTRKALEKSEHNPYLELTLSCKKKISSVLEHLHRKWGSSGIASGELTLLPYAVHPDLANCQRWTLKDKSACAGDIYLIVGSPAVFRLRYGWLVYGDPGSGVLLVPPSIYVNDCAYKDGLDEVAVTNPSIGEVEAGESGQQKLSSLVVETICVADAHYAHEPMITDVLGKAETSMGARHYIQMDDIQMEVNNVQPRYDEQGEMRLDSSTSLAGVWADEFADVSVGELLSESSRAAASASVGPVGGHINRSLEQVPFMCDSFDAAIAAHISGCKEQGDSSNKIPQSSFWDAEETCDGFSFCMTLPGERVASSDRSSAGFQADGFHGLLKDANLKFSDCESAQKEMNPESGSSDAGCSPDNLDTEKSAGLAEIFWPDDSLGALDLDIPLSRYVADDLFNGDSGSLGLSRFMANSLDAFQNVSLFSFGLDKRETSK